MRGMLGVVIGIGPGWEAAAEVAAGRMEANTGVPCEVVRDARGYEAIHPSWLKCKVAEMFPEHDAYMVFDADLVPLKRWDPQGLFHLLRRSFLAVQDFEHEAVARECAEWGIPFPGFYINGGLTIFGHERQPVWDLVWARHPNGGRWLEQTALNHALMVSQTRVVRLPREFNWMTGGNAGTRDLEAAVNVHLEGLGGRVEKVLELQARAGLSPGPSKI